MATTNNTGVEFIFPIAGERGKRVREILEKACSYYGVTLEQLVAHQDQGISRSNVTWKWKKYLIVILMDYTDCDLRDIQKALGYKSYQGVVYNLDKLREELSSEVYGSQKIKLNYNQLLKYLQL